VWLAAVGERLGVEIAPWPAPRAAELAPLPPRAPRAAFEPPAAPPVEPSGPGLQVLRYRSAFSGIAVERMPQLQFQRPAAEVELAHADAEARGIAAGDAVAVGANGTSRELRARVSRRLRPGVIRIAEDHAAGLEASVEVRKA
jgi:anaerobic selenocysteine-containing dehydrogenase